MQLADRVSAALRLRANVARHRGTAVRCPICDLRFDRFRDDGGRPNAICWRCGAHERHRAQWLLFQTRPELLGGARSLLHFAPEWTLRRKLKTISHLRYVTADLSQPDVDLRLDLTALRLPDASFDAAICSHVLEHIPDDRSAIAELRRIIAPGGWCLVMVPLDMARAQTHEDPSITDPPARQLAFWGRDHVRLYAVDIGDRLTAAGFAVEQVSPEAEFGAETCRECALLEADQMWLCRPQAR